MQRILQRAGLLQHQQEIAPAIRELHLILHVLELIDCSSSWAAAESAPAGRVRCCSVSSGSTRRSAVTSRIDVRFVDVGFLRDGQNENQQYRTEAAANAVQKREAEYLELATFAR